MKDTLHNNKKGAPLGAPFLLRLYFGTTFFEAP
jgi:hypothetical protein